jgi:hypothetical protein
MHYIMAMVCVHGAVGQVCEWVQRRISGYRYLHLDTSQVKPFLPNPVFMRIQLNPSLNVLVKTDCKAGCITASEMLKKNNEQTITKTGA